MKIRIEKLNREIEMSTIMKDSKEVLTHNSFTQLYREAKKELGLTIQPIGSPNTWFIGSHIVVPVKLVDKDQNIEFGLGEAGVDTLETQISMQYPANIAYNRGFDKVLRNYFGLQDYETEAMDMELGMEKGLPVEAFVQPSKMTIMEEAMPAPAVTPVETESNPGLSPEEAMMAMQMQMPEFSLPAEEAVIPAQVSSFESAPVMEPVPNSCVSVEVPPEFPEEAFKGMNPPDLCFFNEAAPATAPETSQVAVMEKAPAVATISAPEPVSVPTPEPATSAPTELDSVDIAELLKSLGLDMSVATVPVMPEQPETLSVIGEISADATISAPPSALDTHHVNETEELVADIAQNLTTPAAPVMPTAPAAPVAPVTPVAPVVNAEQKQSGDYNVVENAADVEITVGPYHYAEGQNTIGTTPVESLQWIVDNIRPESSFAALRDAALTFAAQNNIALTV